MAQFASASADDRAVLVDSLSELREDRAFARNACVVVWGLQSVHQLLRLPPATPADLEALALRESRKDLVSLESGGDRAATAITLGQEVQVGSHRRREVSLAAASGADVRRRIQPLADAGFVIDGVLTPALALAALAREDADALPQTVSVYVALTAQATCLAIVRDGIVLFAREMNWGHAGDTSVGAQEAIGTRLAAELKRSVLYFKQTFRAPVNAVVLCGDMPHLRTLTAPLGAALGVPVKPLDSLVGIDAANVPEPADRFRADVAALRLAIAAAADPAPAANLLPSTIRVSRAARSEMWRMAAAVAAGVALVLAVFLLVQRSATASVRQAQAIEEDLARLEPEAARLDELRQVHTLATARQAALGAFDSQGPRLARLLEAISQSVPDDVLLSSLAVSADGAVWTAVVAGVAVAEDAASGQAAVNAFIERLSASPFAGPTTQPPALRVVSGGAAVDAGMPFTLPEGLSGVEFTLNMRLAR